MKKMHRAARAGGGGASSSCGASFMPIEKLCARVNLICKLVVVLVEQIGGCKLPPRLEARRRRRRRRASSRGGSLHPPICSTNTTTSLQIKFTLAHNFSIGMNEAPHEEDAPPPPARAARCIFF